MTLQEMREKRGQLVADARKILDTAQTEKRELTAEESGRADTMMDEAEKIGAQIKAKETAERRTSRLAEAEAELRETNRPPRNPNSPSSTTPGREAPEGRGADERDIEYRTRGRHERRFAIDPATDRRASREYRDRFNRYLSTGVVQGLDHGNGGERRDLQADDDTGGGYLLAPTQMVARMIQAVDDAVFIRQYATVLQLTSAQNIGAPTLDTDIADSDWTTEIQTGSKDTALKFGKREMNPVPLAKRILVSRKLLRSSAMPVETIVRNRLGYKFAISQEKGFLTGNGANAPLGLFTASSNGISTGRDVQTGSATSITADGLIDAKFSLKAAYWNRPTTRWLFHRDAIKIVRKLKDTTNQYLWQPGLSAGEPDRILDIPYDISEYVPNTFTTGLYVGLLGDLSLYWIVESLNLEVQRLNELYAETNQIGYIGRMELDGMPVLEEGFARLKTN